MAVLATVSGERVARFVSGRLGAFCPPFVCVGVERDGEIIGGVLINHFEHNDVHVSLAGSGWTKGFIKAVGEYVYQSLGYGRMTAVTESQKVADYAVRLGGVIEGRMRNHFGPGRDAMIIGILREEWVFAKATKFSRG